MNNIIEYRPIGIIHSPFMDLANMPIQPKGAQGIQGTIHIYEEFVDALRDLDGFSHIQLLYHFHRAHGWKPLVKPFMDDVKRGLFATRAPKRPNPIGLSVVRLVRIEGNILHIENVDILNETPLVDIKPYIPIFDQPQDVRIGWLQGKDKQVEEQRSDDRFSEQSHQS